MIVVGCGKTKLDRPAPARELYTGSLFVASRRYAEATGKPWVILSGAHGVVGPRRVIDPYDAGPPETRSGVARWARSCALEVKMRLGSAPAVVTILAGVRYAAPLAGELQALGIESEQLLSGLGVGRRLQRLRQLTEGLER